jgi:hypothetical protein
MCEELRATDLVEPRPWGDWMDGVYLRGEGDHTDRDLLERALCVPVTDIRRLRRFQLNVVGTRCAQVVLMPMMMRLRAVLMTRVRAPEIITVNVDVITVGVRVEEKAGAWGGEGGEKDCQHPRSERPDAESPPPHRGLRYHSP